MVRCLKQYWADNVVVNKYKSEWSVDLMASKTAMLKELQKLLVIGVVMQDACTTHFGRIPNMDHKFIKKPLDCSGERHLMNAKKLAT